ncbi:hypothetical protein, partial [Thiolapillus sp.]|uniref:hypothetical protein n=2 Tax=Thiolapillus sp. TaxID=2017437 RepID=UPI003AF829B6
LAIPYRVATVLVILHGIKLTIPTLPPKGVGFTDPLSGTLNNIDQIILLDKGQMKGCGGHQQLLVNTHEHQALQAFVPVFNR